MAEFQKHRLGMFSLAKGHGDLYGGRSHVVRREVSTGSSRVAHKERVEGGGVPRAPAMGCPKVLAKPRSQQTMALWPKQDWTPYLEIGVATSLWHYVFQGIANYR